MVASAIFFLDWQGNTLLARNYRGDIPMSTVENFPMLLLRDGVPSPCITYEGVNYIYITINNVYILVLSKDNSDAGSILLFLHHVVKVFKEYFKHVEEESIRDNYVVIYELLDEMMDFGHPQITDAKVLQEYITQESHALDEQARASTVVTNTISWRPEGIFYKKNELFLDVIESYNCTLAADGSVITNEIVGKINCSAYLSGMPILKLGLNDSEKKPPQQASTDGATSTVQRARKGKYVNMEDVKFHQCVQLDQFEKDRTITFTPPDGNFELLSYRIRDVQSKPLFLVDTDIDVRSHSRVIVTVRAKSQYRKRSVGTVEIAVPVPPDADSPKFKAQIGTVVYAPERNAVLWKIKQFTGGKEATMTAQLQLSSIDVAEDDDRSDSNWAYRNKVAMSKQPVSVNFEIPYLAVSGLQVRYLKVTEPNLRYQSLPWVRYLTKSDDYNIRLPIK
ncbi:hypothetical protein TRICI_002492 [Trichomonascus ciferrii]|uniref:MHD domain-containing protein n=1 Tax=Trichomonascus ciferrii TaxID=44093 RepID=A0A642V6N9_9ASCO|nr:hypothetical protein TRICI_002492 [Trichomonascus ciferrii]